MNAVASIPATVRLATEAMRCRFELLLTGDDPRGLRAAGEEALREIRSLGAQLNVFSPAGELSRINRDAARAPVRVSPRLFALLQKARELHDRTRGAFDPTLGPLVRLWREARNSARPPTARALRDARDRTGMDRVELDPKQCTVRFHREGCELNLNALAKGYALDEAAIILREAGVASALLHGGASSVLAIGSPPDARAWPVGLADPLDPERILSTVDLRDNALGVSGQNLQTHVLDPRTGEPAPACLAAVVSLRAADADALATAMLCAPRAATHWLRPLEKALMVPA
jgi:FAD:protein FMN transferase